MEIVLFVVGVDNCVVGILGEGVDCQVVVQQIGFEGDVWGGIVGKIGIVCVGFVFGVGQGIFFLVLWMEEYGKIVVYLLIVCVQYLLWGGVYYYLVLVFDWQFQQCVMYCVIDQIIFYV